MKAQLTLLKAGILAASTRIDGNNVLITGSR
jgi:hypothetical protein